MRILLINQFFPPDAAPTGHMLASVARELSAKGHQVSVICSSGGYADVSRDRPDDRFPEGEAKVFRTPTLRLGRKVGIGKVIDYGLFFAGSLVVALKLLKRPDRVIVLSTPPFLSCFARVFSKFLRADHGHWIMDVYPDVIQAHGLMSSSSMAYRLLQRAMRWGLSGKRSAVVHTLSSDMAGRLQDYVSNGKSVDWTPLWNTDGDEMTATDDCVREEGVDDLRERRGWGRDEVVFVYSGNMGLGHRFQELRAVLGNESESISGARVAFFGGGPRRDEVEGIVQSSVSIPAEIGDYVPQEELSRHLRTADVHLVSLEPSWTALMAPSKLQGVFAAGRPTIFIGSVGSSMARWVLDADAGWVVEPGDVAALWRAMRSALDADVRRRKGANAHQFARANFSENRNAALVADLLSSPMARGNQTEGA